MAGSKVCAHKSVTYTICQYRGDGHASPESDRTDTSCAREVATSDNTRQDLDTHPQPTNPSTTPLPPAKRWCGRAGSTAKMGCEGYHRLLLANQPRETQRRGETRSGVGQTRLERCVQLSRDVSKLQMLIPDCRKSRERERRADTRWSEVLLESDRPELRSSSDTAYTTVATLDIILRSRLVLEIIVFRAPGVE